MAKKPAKSIVTQLLSEAATIDAEEFTLNMPLYVLLGEAIDVARFCEYYWATEHHPLTKTVIRPGLELAGKARLPKSIAAEIVALHDLVQDAQTAYLLAGARPLESTERAELVLDELASALEWVCDQHVDEATRAKLAAIVGAHRDDPDSEDALALELASYAGVAAELEDELADVPAFDSRLIGEAKQLSLTLRERSAMRSRGRAGEPATLLRQRNRLASMLLGRINVVRAAARYVFRHHDNIVKQVTSAYQRRRRAAARRRATEAANTPPVPTPAVVTELAEVG